MSRYRNKESFSLTRRDFARGIALTAATVAVPRKTSAHVESASVGTPQEATAQATQLSPTGRRSFRPSWQSTESGFRTSRKQMSGDWSRKRKRPARPFARFHSTIRTSPR